MKEDESEKLIADAIAASMRGDSAHAFVLLHIACEKPGADGVPWLLLGAEHASLGQLPEAESAYAEAALRSPNLDIARFQLGLLQISTGRTAIGSLTWLPLLERPSDDALTRYVEGYLALIDGRLDQAVELLTLGLSLPQGNEPLSGDIRRTIAAIGQRKFEQSAASVAVSEPSTDHHVLLSNYADSSLRH